PLPRHGIFFLCLLGGGVGLLSVGCSLLVSAWIVFFEASAVEDCSLSSAGGGGKGLSSGDEGLCSTSVEACGSFVSVMVIDCGSLSYANPQKSSCRRVSALL